MSSDPRSDSSKPSEPIPINTRFGRGRSASVSSASSGSASSPSEVVTPISTSAGSARFGPASPTNSPIFSYFFNQSPTKAPPGATNTFPFRKFGPPPLYEEDEPEKEPAVAHHARRASTAVAGRFAQAPSQPAMPEPNAERGTGLLRRLSLSTAFARPADLRSNSPPNVPPNSAVTSPMETRQLPPFTRQGGRPRRSATISLDAKPRRAPSPMGERILKGHFDGFN
ncbi:hypothetical protein CPB85DRAFT_1374295 [Mucidula mucida]|nr:hypothetical protein CPB85DRAFT_1374295 [Mucidula mucida]